MTERMQKAILDLKAKQENGEYTRCPRCGMNSMRPDLYTNALSRAVDIMVCSACGADEAKLAWMRAPMSLYRWAALQPQRPEGDFTDIPGHEAWRIIKEHQAGTLFDLYRLYLDGEEPEEVRFLAFERIPGLTEIWTEPYQLKFRCRDGSLIVRFVKLSEGWEMIADVVEGK